MSYIIPVPTRMMTIPEIADTGLLSAYALRRMLRAGNLPVVRVGRKVLVNYDALVLQLQAATTYGSDNGAANNLW